MIFGVGDYSIDMRTQDRVFGRPSAQYAVLTDADAAGQRRRHWNDQWHFAMARIATACRAWGLRPIDGPYTDFGDAEGYRACAERARALGFEGKWAIHPTQIALGNEVFSPTRDELDWATGIGELLAQAARDGQGAVGAGGVLIDMAHAKLATYIEQRHALIARTAQCDREDTKEST
jgi:malyl-CoA/(S)-citramalyl-CoA lyase